MIWIVHFLVVCTLFLIAKYTKKDNFFIRSTFFYLLFVFGQRWMTGTDFPHYLRYYLTDFKVREPGFYLIQKFLAVNNLYFGLLIFITYAITITNNYRFIKKINRHVVLIVFLYLFSELFFVQLSQIRQFIAVSFFVNSFYYAHQKNVFKSALNVLLGALFHVSILFLVPFLFIKLKLDKMKTMYLLLLSAVLPLINFSFLLKLKIFSRYSHYLDSIFNVNLSVFHYLKFYIILVFIMFFVYDAKPFKKVKLDQMIVNGMVFNMLLYGLSFQFAPLLRISYYFKIFEIVFLVYYHKELRSFSTGLIKTALIALFVFIYAGLALTDPFLISDYQFRRLRIRDNRTNEQLQDEYYEFINGE